jgi:hypothetical protein
MSVRPLLVQAGGEIVARRIWVVHSALASREFIVSGPHQAG